MTTQPTALWLADLLSDRDFGSFAANNLMDKAAAELRRLHEVNAELVETLREAADEIESWGAYASPYFQEKHDLEGSVSTVRAAIAKATGEQQ